MTEQSCKPDSRRAVKEAAARLLALVDRQDADWREVLRLGNEVLEVCEELADDLAPVEEIAEGMHDVIVLVPERGGPPQA